MTTASEYGKHMTTTQIERTHKGTWRVFKQRPDGFLVIGEYSSEAIAKIVARKTAGEPAPRFLHARPVEVKV